MLENWAIVELFWKRSEEALRETSRKYGAYCRTIIRNLLGNRREDVEECENDTLLSAWNAMPTDRPQRLAPFLGRIARNLALDRVDYYTAQKRSCPAQYLLDELSECLPGGRRWNRSWKAPHWRRASAAFCAARAARRGLSL